MGITDALWKEYKAKELEMCGGKRVSAARITDAARWKLLYKVVFPNDASVPSPYYQNQSTSPAVKDIEHDAVFEEYEYLLREFMDTQLREEFSSIVDSIRSRIHDVKTRLLEEAKRNVTAGVRRGGPAPEPPRLSLGGFATTERRRQQRLPPTAALDSSFRAAVAAAAAPVAAGDLLVPATKREPAAAPSGPASPPGSEAAFPPPGPVGGIPGPGPAAAKGEPGAGAGLPAGLAPMDFGPDSAFWTDSDFPMNLGGVPGPDPDGRDRLILEGTVMEDNSPVAGLDDKDMFNSGYWENNFASSNFVTDNN